MINRVHNVTALGNGVQFHPLADTGTAYAGGTSEALNFATEPLADEIRAGGTRETIILQKLSLIIIISFIFKKIYNYYCFICDNL